MALQNSSIDNMNTILGKKFNIPNYQREYSWEADELIDFWADLEFTRRHSDVVHFFGQMVVHIDTEDGNRKYIIDGQQRTITSIIFLRVLQSFYETLYRDSQIADADYHRTDIISIHIGRENDYHLSIGGEDNSFFVDHILKANPINGRISKKSQINLKNARSFFESHIQNEYIKCRDYDAQLSLLNEYYNTFVNRFNMLYMEATKIEEAFIIFETLNARGKELETADLLKNYVLSKSTNNVQNAYRQWTSMINKLDGNDPTKYIRHFINSCSPFSREKELFRTIKSITGSPRACQELLGHLDEYAITYKDLITAKDITSFTDSELINCVKSLKMLKAKTFYPLVLAMKQAKTTDPNTNESISTFQETDIREVLKCIEVFVFKNFTICSNTANSAETFFASLALDVYNAEITSAEEITQSIREKIENDEVFETAFRNWKGTSSNKDYIRYIFQKIHAHLDDVHEINLDNTEVHIEHIMPQDINLWPEVADIHEDYLWRLGNLALLSGPINIALSNRPFSEKKDGYLQSVIKPNNEIAEYDEWNVTSIENRQDSLLAYAREIWN